MRLQGVVARGVTRMFGSTAALSGVSIDLKAGELVFLEGPNGAGKSTLLAVLGAVLSPSQGSVSYPPFGDDVWQVRGEIGWLSHEAHVYRDLTARENIVLAAELRGLVGGRCFEECSERFGLAAFADKPFSALSRGQRQRVALARAVLHQPGLLLLDEPFSGLDPRSGERLEQVIAEERERGAVVVVVNHQPGLAERLHARCIRLERGRVV